MDPVESYQLALTEPVELVEHSNQWEIDFSRERDRILNRYSDRVVEIRHFGSTAVPGLAAKPTIDMIAGMTNFAAVDDLIESLLGFNYSIDREGNAPLTDRKWLFRHNDGHRTHHLHLVQHNSPAWHDRVDFCEFLKTHESLRKSYREFKFENMNQLRDDRTAYAEQKGSFVKEALDKYRR